MRNDPFGLSNIKTMVGNWAGYKRARVGDVRIVFWIDKDKNIIYVDHIGPRGDIYKGRARRELDFMQALMEARYADGRSLRDEEITGLLLTALFAGQHLSGVLAAWVGIDLLRQLDSPPPVPDHGSWVTGPRPPCRVRYRRRPIPLCGGL
jgi:hypothetical protein